MAISISKRRGFHSLCKKRRVIEDRICGLKGQRGSGGHRGPLRPPGRWKCRLLEHRYNALPGSSPDGHYASQFPEGDHSPLRSGRSVCLPRICGDPAETWFPDQHVSKGNPYDNATAESFIKTLKTKRSISFCAQATILNYFLDRLILSRYSVYKIQYLSGRSWKQKHRN